VSFEEAVEAVEGATGAFLGGVFADSEGVADAAEVVAFEVSADNDVAVGGAQLVDGFVEQGKETRDGVGFVLGGIHLGGGVGLFALFETGFPSLELGDFEFGGGVEPTGEVGVEVCEFAGVDGEGEQDVLGRFFGELPVVRAAEAYGEDHVDVASGEGAEGSFVPVLGVGHEEVGVAGDVGSCRVHEWETLGGYTRWRERSDRKVLMFGDSPGEAGEWGWVGVAGD